MNPGESSLRGMSGGFVSQRLYPDLAAISSFAPLDIHCNAMYCANMLTKELVAASTEPLVLSILSGGESYGYALIQEVKTAFRG